MNKFLVTSIFIICSLFYINNGVDAHSGRTDSSGCHNCYTSYCYGEYHCHNGGYTQPAPVINTPIFPKMNATNEFIPDVNGTYKVNFLLDDANPTQYSAILSKCKGCNPGPSVDFSSPQFSFSDVSPGIWYLNVKKEIGGTWSSIVYWTVEVPAWISPYPTEVDSVKDINSPEENLNADTESDDGSFFSWAIPISAVGLGGYLLGKRKNKSSNDS